MCNRTRTSSRSSERRRSGGKRSGSGSSVASHPDARTSSALVSQRPRVPSGASAPDGECGVIVSKKIVHVNFHSSAQTSAKRERILNQTSVRRSKVGLRRLVMGWVFPPGAPLRRGGVYPLKAGGAKLLRCVIWRGETWGPGSASSQAPRLHPTYLGCPLIMLLASGQAGYYRGPKKTYPIL